MRIVKYVALGMSFAVMTSWQPHAASGTTQASCSVSARSVLKSCKERVVADYWLSVGKCQNLSNQSARRKCTLNADGEQLDALEECGDQDEARLTVCGQLGESSYEPRIRPSDFVGTVDNPYLPYIAGTTSVYEGQTSDGTERVVVEVTHDTREILGVPCKVVRDRGYLNGELTEDTLDYYAQDSLGNVWYFGEISYEIEAGVIVSVEGSWEAGVNGAYPGIVMPANPMVGDHYRQEFQLGEAEDMGGTLSLDAAITVPFGSFSGCRQTADTTPISPGSLEHKFYAPGVGLVAEVDPATGSRTELISVSH